MSANAMVTFEELVEVMSLDLAEENTPLHYTAEDDAAFLMLDQSDRSEGIIDIMVFEVRPVSKFMERLKERLELDDIPMDKNSSDIYEIVWELLVTFYCVVKFDE